MTPTRGEAIAVEEVAASKERRSRRRRGEVRPSAPRIRVEARPSKPRMWLPPRRGATVDSEERTTAGKHVTIDESMIWYMGRAISYVQYMPAKPIKHGIKAGTCVHHMLEIGVRFT